MDIIFSASIIAAFLAGMVALFAPCCITVLLPAYLASAFREKKHILKMTLVFFAGIAAILVPIGLGAAWLAEIFRDFHKEMYIVGGIFMLTLSVLSISGKGLSLVPMPKRVLKTAGMQNSKSVFFLGMFSGAATSCCAPVLAGAMALAVVSAAFWKAIIVTFAYVFGMTFPLFIAAYFYDRLQIENSTFIKGRLLEIKIGSKIMFIHSTNMLAEVVFLIMGIVLLTLAFTENAFWSPSLQADIGKSLNLWSQKAFSALSTVPELVWGIIIIGIFAFFAYRAKK
ncbi:MAG: cytochrome c biogenesis protein CcdA [Parcubacteria group bacterium]|nr:cytochrome c biogenesis protein CcdA [Parcubacteria group bacterium]